ncbi:MAG: DUF5069 domain-containing protein [Verrucomicrobiae bacterium]|nr:DUF5069 domain-containing protein [Verrucomicrobiae bacterium]
MSYAWDSEFNALFERCLARYRSGDTDFETYYSEDDLAFLDSIGYRKREFFDFVEDLAEMGEPSLTTAVMIASVRRDYLAEIMGGKKSTHILDPSTLPAKTSETEGIVWFPRILAKARAKLRGELDPNTMYCCGGDRAFLKRHDIAPADFLRAVWAAGDDDQAVLDYVRRNSKA